MGTIIGADRHSFPAERYSGLFNSTYAIFSFPFETIKIQPNDETTAHTLLIPYESGLTVGDTIGITCYQRKEGAGISYEEIARYAGARPLVNGFVFAECHTPPIIGDQSARKPPGTTVDEF